MELGTTLESLGVLVYRGELSLGLVDDFFSDAIVLCWRKCRRYIEELRAPIVTGSPRVGDAAGGSRTPFMTAPSPA